MREPLPKPRSSLTTTTGITTNNICNSKAAPWTTTRCHRLLRPLTAKLQALRNIIRNNPSATSANAARPKPKRDLTDPDALFVEAVEKAAGRAGATGTRIRTKPRRTYGGGNGSGARSNSGSSAALPAPATATATTLLSGINDHYLSIWGDSAAPTAPTDPNPLKKPSRALPPDPNNPLTLLNSFKPILHPSIFSVYLGIYTSLESVLLSTNYPTPVPQILPLRTLAARKIAHCILATFSEVDSDDIWYDAAAELGSSGEYLREIVRWHAIELVRDATAEGLMDGRDGGLGMAGVLVGLCRAAGAEQEAQSLLQTLFDLHPVISSSNNPAIQALTMFFSETPEVLYRFLAKNFPATSSNPSWLGSTDIHAFLLLASAEIDENPGIEILTSCALEATFGLWGDKHILALAAQRHDAAKRRAPRRSIKPLETIPEHAARKTTSPMPARIGLKAETIVLKMVESLILLSLRDQSSKATPVLRSLVRGFLAQSVEIKMTTEDVWGARYPVAAKVAILLHGLGVSSADDVSIIDEITRCLEDVCGSGGTEGMKSLASFIADCYMPLYGRFPKRDEVQILTARILSLAAADPARAVSGDVPPVTPRVPAGRGMVTFTPGKPALAPAQELRETRRYLLAQLALQIAVGFSLGGEVKRDVAWIEWLGRFEHKIIGLKIQTPGKVKAILRQREVEFEEEEDRRGMYKKRDGGKAKKRKGWRYEEGLDLWVALGATPGRERSKKKRGVFMKRVEVTIDEDVDWRDGYEALDSEKESDSESDHERQGEHESEDEVIVEDEVMADVSDSEPESETSEYTNDRPVTPTLTVRSSASDDDNDNDDDNDDKEFYSNIHTSPPRTLRRSPRNTARIRKSLATFAVNMSSPIFTVLRTPGQGQSVLRRPFDFSMVGASSPLVDSSPVVRGGFWSGGVRVGDSSPVVRRSARKELREMEDEDEEEEEEEEQEQAGDTEDESEDQHEDEEEQEQEFVGVRPRNANISSSPQPMFGHSSPSPASKRKHRHVSPINLMDSEEEDTEPQETEFELDEDDSDETDEASLFEVAINTALPASSPPPPTSPVLRRPRRISLRSTTPAKTVLTPRLDSNVAPTPQRTVAGNLKQQRKVEKSAQRRRRGRVRKRARRLVEDGLSADELGM